MKIATPKSFMLKPFLRIFIFALVAKRVVFGVCFWREKNENLDESAHFVLPSLKRLPLFLVFSLP